MNIVKVSEKVDRKESIVKRRERELVHGLWEEFNADPEKRITKGRIAELVVAAFAEGVQAKADELTPEFSRLELEVMQMREVCEGLEKVIGEMKVPESLPMWKVSSIGSISRISGRRGGN